MKDQYSLLSYLFRETSGKYRKFRTRIDKAIQTGRFQKLSKRKQSSLLHRLRKLLQQLQRFYLQLKFAGAAATLTITCSLFNPASAQTTIGPFDRTDRGENVLRGPFRFSGRPNPTLVDWDGDGDLDLVVGHNNEWKYFEYRTSEHGNGFHEVIEENNPFNSLESSYYNNVVPVFIDYDKDGDLDIFYGTQSDGADNIIYVKNEGETLVPQSADQDWIVETATGSPFRSLDVGNNNGPNARVAFIDYDNDGDYDALISQELEATGFYFYRNDQVVLSEDPLSHTITYTRDETVALPFWGTYDAAPQFIDLDRDSDLDLVVGDGEKLRYFKNIGNNNFVEQEGSYDVVTETGNPFDGFSFSGASPALGDADGDGDIDVIVATDGGGYLGQPLHYLENVGDPEESNDLIYEEKTFFDNPIDGYVNSADYTHSYRVSTPAFIDVDNDGDMDALLGEKYTGEIVYFRNDDGKMVPAPSPLGEVSFTETPSPAVVDINGDGFQDIFVGMNGYPPEPATLLFLNNKNGTFTQVTPEQNPLTDIEEFQTIWNVRLAFLDVDADGDFDAFAGDEGYGFYFLRNTGTSTDPSFEIPYDDPENPETPTNPISDDLGYRPAITTGDIDGDGDLDFIAGPSGGTVRVFLNSGYYSDDIYQVQFTEVTGIENPFNDVRNENGVAYSFPTPGFVDSDLDGDIDLFVNIAGGTFDFYRNTNPPPTLNTDYNTLQFEVNADPIFINPSFTLNDADGDSYSEARITIVGYEQGRDLIGYDGVDLSEAVSMEFDYDNGIFRVFRIGSESDYLTALQGIHYQYVEEIDLPDGDQREKNPSGRTISKTIRFEVFDQDRTTPQPVDFTLTHNNIPPALASTDPPATFTSTSGAILVDNSILVTDDDDETISSATVDITGGFVSTEDRLEATDPLGVLSITYLTGTGRLLITGTSSKLHYLLVLRSVRYNNIATFPDFTPRTLQMTINDGEDNSTPQEITVNFNLSPALTLAQSTVSYSGSPIPLDNSATIFDDNSGITSAVLTFTAGYISAEDRLLFTDQSGITGSFDASAGVLTLTGSATRADYQSAIRTIMYSNLSSTPTATPRDISISMQDASGNASNLVSLTVNFTSQNPPALATTVSSVNYVTGALVISNDLSVSDLDDTQLASASVTISSGFVSTEDVLTFTPSGGITGAFDAPAGVLSLNGAAPLADYETVLRSVTYQNTNTGDRNKGARILIFRVNDGIDNSNSITITVNLPNQAPALSNTAPAIQYSSGNILVADQISLTDGDNATIQSATIQISAGFIDMEDILLFTDQNGITGTFNNTTGTLQLIGTASLLNYQSAIRSVRYQNINAGDRNKNTRTITILANDGITNSNAGTVALSLPNQTPALTAGPNPPLYGSGAIPIFASATVTDTDNATLQSATVSITAGLRVSEDQLIFTNQNGITGSYNNATGVLQLTGAATKTSYETAIRSVQYQNSSASPDPNARTITATISDGLVSSAAATITLSINQPPVIAADEPIIEAGGTVNFDITELASDPDNNLDLGNINSITIAAQPQSGAVATLVNGILVIDYSGVPDFTGVDRLSVTLCDNLNRCTTQELTIQVGAELVVYNAVSAFKDGYNDFLFLRYIDPENHVTIYNRWGDKVFERDNYDNNDAAKRFEGINDNGEKLPSGTYFYKIEYGNTVAATGYLTLKQ